MQNVGKVLIDLISIEESKRMQLLSYKLMPIDLGDTFLSIISRLQSALGEACRQRDEEMQYNPMSKSTKEMWRDRKNNQIKEILAGPNQP